MVVIALEASKWLEVDYVTPHNVAAVWPLQKAYHTSDYSCTARIDDAISRWDSIATQCGGYELEANGST